ncbi:MAG: tRNA threonylcarbamoyladenosine dehydratase [Lachnospiraceae bacterium]|nr:tRNA threonylcarbamoyladenosine dehydratase [Lachnospiraceae bacterium]
MNKEFSRSALLLGEAAITRLAKARVAIFGVGGVGGYVCEALVRSGVGAFDLIDKDVVDVTNINRQIIATQSTVGRPKVEVMKERMLDINPDAEIVVHECFYLPENAHEFDFSQYDFVVDCVDTVTAKIQIIMQAKEAGTPVISSMGAGNKLDAGRFKVADIYKTNVDPLARVMRRELKKRGVKKLTVVYSDEEPMTPIAVADSLETDTLEETAGRVKQTPGSMAFVPGAAGLIIAGEVVRQLVSTQGV